MTPIKFSELTFAPTAPDRGMILEHFPAYPMAESKLHADIARQEAALDAMVEALGQTDHLIYVLEGLRMSRRMDVLRVWTGIQKAPAIAARVAQELGSGLVERTILLTEHRPVQIELKHRLKGHAQFLLSPNSEKRQDILAGFRKSQKPAVLIALVAALDGRDDVADYCSDVIFAEPSWTMTNNVQAVLRLWNARQKHPVSVRFCALQNSPDAMIVRLIKNRVRTKLEELSAQKIAMSM